MTALIWMLTWLPQVLPAVSKLLQPVNLNLTSNHLRHMLKWEPGPGTPTGVCYRVDVKTETGSTWVQVAGCECVQHTLVCNLTEAFSDPKQVYFTQVTALLGEQASQSVFPLGFQPIRDTHLDLPLLTVTPCGMDLCVDLKPPMGHLREIYGSLHYKLRITSNSSNRAQFFKVTKFLRREVLEDLAPGRQYCVSVCFLDSQVPKESNYSKPVCAFTPGIFTADALISAMLCLLVMSGVVAVALLVSAGFICLKKRLQPSVLTSIHHVEEVMVVPSPTFLSSLVSLKPTLPSSGEERSNQTSSDESDEESVTESTDGSGGGGYELKGGPNPLSSFSTSSLSPLLSPEPEPSPSFSSNQTSDVFNPQPEAQTQTHSSSGWIGALSSHTASHSDSVPQSPQRASDPCLPADTQSLTGGRTTPNQEEKEAAGQGNSLDVNLLTLTFGRQEEENEEDEESHLDMTEVELEPSSASEVYNATQILLSQTRNTKEVAIEGVSYSAEEEEEEQEEYSGYMGHLSTDVLKNLL